jgi:hypothetical protein
MEILEVGLNEYLEVLKAPYHAFNYGSFNDLNSSKCEKIFYFLFKEGKYRLGFVGGVIENVLLSPFSAPFGGFSYISPDVRLQYIEEAIKLLINWAQERKLTSIRITLPPPFYQESFITKQINCFWRQNFEISEIDLNYSFELENFGDSYADHIWYNARKNLQISIKSGLKFRICANDSDKELAYNIISRNRESHGYPLRMSWDQVSETVRIIPADFFLVQNVSENTIASAIVFHISTSVVQVVYWGDLQGYSEIRPMNFLAYKVFEYYKNTSKKVVDIGPSSEHSLPNYGLCEFKEGIGCRIDPKYTIVKTLE